MCIQAELKFEYRKILQNFFVNVFHFFSVFFLTKEEKRFGACDYFKSGRQLLLQSSLEKFSAVCLSYLASYHSEEKAMRIFFVENLILINLALISQKTFLRDIREKLLFFTQSYHYES